MRPYSELRHHQRKVLRDEIPLHKPFTILFDPSSHCNFKCLQCFHSVPDKARLMPRGMMKFDDFRKVIDDLRAWRGERIKVIRLIGFGEPFMNRDYGRMLEYVAAAGVAERLETTSNCSLLTSDLSRRLVKCGLDYLRASIYSPLQEKHRRITGSGVDIRVLHDNLAVLQAVKKECGSLRPFVYVKMIDSFDEEENRLFFEMYRDVADEMKIEKPHNWLDMEDKDYLGDLYGEKKKAVVESVDYEATMKKVCPQPFKMMSVRFNGDVVVCDPDWLNHTKVGNAFDETLEEIWNGERMYEFRMMHLEGRRSRNESCRRCRTFLTDEYSQDNIDGFPPERFRRSVMGGDSEKPEGRK